MQDGDLIGMGVSEITGSECYVFRLLQSFLQVMLFDLCLFCWVNFKCVIYFFAVLRMIFLDSDGVIVFYLLKSICYKEDESFCLMDSCSLCSIKSIIVT